MRGFLHLKGEISPFIDLKNSPFEVRIVFHTFRGKFHPLKFRVYAYKLVSLEAYISSRIYAKLLLV